MASLYRSIYEDLKTSILNGSLKSGQALPSSRVLANELSVSRNTVLAAFAHLEAEGFVISKHGSGIYVREIPVQKEIRDKRKYSLLLGEKEQRKPLHPFSMRPGGTDIRHFPFAEFFRLMTKVYRNSSHLNFSYSASGGYRPLQEAISYWLRIKRGVQSKPEQIVLTNGSQEAIYLIGLLFLKLNKKVYIENPVYNGARKIFDFLGADLRYIHVDKEGMEIDDIPNQRGGLVYVTPSHQFPLGYTMSIARRLQLLEKAKKQDLIILEDDYDSDFRYNGDPISSLQGYDNVGRVIYVGSFSKVLFPAIRLGFAIVPEIYLNEFLNQKKIINQDPSILYQAAVAEFIRSGKFFRHLKKMHTLYHLRKLYLEKRLKEEFSDILELEECQSGLHLVAHFKKRVNRKELEVSFSKKGLEVSFLSEHIQGRDTAEALILGFAAFNEKELEKGIGIMKKVFF